VGWYLLRVGNSLIALVHHQQFLAMISERPITKITRLHHETAAVSIAKSLRYARNNPQYYYDQGSYLHRFYSESPLPEVQALKGTGLQDAESSLKTAVMLDPGNPWYYYELGRLNSEKGKCVDPTRSDFSQKPWECPTARYFLAALKKAPLHTFLRRHVGAWYYQYDPENTFPIIQQMISRTPLQASGEDQAQSVEFSKFLYEIGLDYESDLRYQEATENAQEMAQCSTISTISSSHNQTHAQEIELGNDDGLREWKTYLRSETERVKKVICLPENIDDYDYAAVKIFMSNGGSAKFVAQISINDHLIQQYEYTVPRTSTWYEIPFDTALLAGQSHINVYIRVSEASASRQRNYLQVFGDGGVPTTHSVRNFQITHDLSHFEGIQTGEYMIRILLRKTGNYSAFETREIRE
jgi:hypothetical protein